MPGPRPKVRWHERSNAWRSDVGPVKEGGRRTPVYFREIPNTDKGRRQAQRMLEEYVRRRDEELESRRADNITLTVGEVCRLYLAQSAAQVKAGKRSAETHRSHVDRLKRVLGLAGAGGVEVGHMPAARFSDDDAHRIAEDLAAEGCGPMRVRGVLMSCNAVFEWASRPIRGRDPKILVRANPFRGVRGEAIVRAARQVITRDDLAKFLRSARSRSLGAFSVESGRCGACRLSARQGDRTHRNPESTHACQRSHGARAVHERLLWVLARLQFAVGSRPKELCEAQWSEVEVGDARVSGWEPRAWKDPATGHWWGLITVFGKTTRSTGRLRQVQVPPALARSIERIRAQGLHETWIFPRRAVGKATEGRWTTQALDGWVRRHRDAAGLPGGFVLYAARHGMYTRAVQVAGLTGEQAGAVGGTSGEVVRRVYVQGDAAAQFESAARINRAGRAPTKSSQALPDSPR